MAPVEASCSSLPRVARPIFAAVLGLSLLGLFSYSAITTWVYPSNAALQGQCEAWLERPVARWVSLKKCTLDVEMTVLESDQGDYETLSDRKEGLSRKLYAMPPNWVALWVPIRTESTGTGLVRAVYRLESKDALQWVNKFERANDREKDRMWADPAPIRRLSRPGVLPGKADKPTDEAMQQAFASAASANLLSVIAGSPPPLEPPTLGILAGLLGLVSLGYAVRKRAPEPTAEQQITALNVSDVKLEIGALEALRNEERENRRNRKID